MIVSDKSFLIAKKRVKPAKFVRKQLAPGQFIKIEVEEEEKKMDDKMENKMLKGSENKKNEPQKAIEQDDLSSIPGVGVATIRALVAHGVKSFDDLRSLDLESVEYLNDRVKRSIEKWVKNG